MSECKYFKPDAYSGPERRKDHEARKWFPSSTDTSAGGAHWYREAYRRGRVSEIDELTAKACKFREKAVALLRRARPYLTKPVFQNPTALHDEIEAFLSPLRPSKRKGERRKVSAEVRFVVNDDRCRGWAVLRGSDEHGEIWGKEQRTPHDRRKGGIS